MEVMTGTRIREERRERKMKQSELARILGITPKTLCQIESEQSNSFEVRFRATEYFNKEEK